jgi:hypothetical protein
MLVAHWDMRVGRGALCLLALQLEEIIVEPKVGIE